MLLKFIRLCLIFILIGGGFILYNQQWVRDWVGSYFNSSIGDNMFSEAQKSVKGISTNKSEEITNQLQKDVGNGIDQAQKQVLNMRVSDIVDFFNKGQKISSDFHVFQESVKKDIESQIENLGKKK